MKTTRRRILSTMRPNERTYWFRARRFDGFTRTNVEGHSRAKIVASGYGKTPREAILNARKSVKRRAPKHFKSRQELAADRAYYQKLSEQFERRVTLTPREKRSVLRATDHEHVKVPTHPLAYRYAWRCSVCGSKGGIKPGRPDPLRDYY